MPTKQNQEVKTARAVRALASELQLLEHALASVRDILSTGGDENVLLAAQALWERANMRRAKVICTIEDLLDGHDPERYKD